MKLWGTFICTWIGHKRGKRGVTDAVNGLTFFQCPRCGHTWTRKVRKLKQEA